MLLLLVLLLQHWTVLKYPSYESYQPALPSFILTFLFD